MRWCWNWQTGMVEGHVAQAVGVRFPPSAQQIGRNLPVFCLIPASGSFNVIHQLPAARCSPLHQRFQHSQFFHFQRRADREIDPDP